MIQKDKKSNIKIKIKTINIFEKINIIFFYLVFPRKHYNIMCEEYNYI